MPTDADELPGVSEPSSSWLTAALAEHSAARGEVVAALAAQHAVFSYGVAAVGLLTAVAVGATSGDTVTSGYAQTLATIILLGLNPVLLVAVLFLWTTEVLRMQRAGAYIFALESVINAKVGKPAPLAWEGVLNPPRNKYGQTEERVFPNVDVMQRWAVSLALMAITAGSVASGIVLGDPGMGRYIFGGLVTVTTAYFGLLVWAFFDGNRLWLRALYAHTRGQNEKGATPLSIHDWAAGLSRSRWTSYLQGPLSHLPLPWDRGSTPQGGSSYLERGVAP